MAVKRPATPGSWATRCIVGLGIAAMSLLVACSASDSEGLVDRERALDLNRVLWERTEELIQECMSDEGFEYSPRPYAGGQQIQFAESPFDLSLEEAEARGFGFVDDLIASAGAEEADPAEPNEVAKNDLPTTQQRPWEVALDGITAGEEGGGCRRHAEQEARKENADLIASVLTRADDVGARMEEDARFQAIWDAWSDCMKERGIQADDLLDLQARLIDETNELISFPALDLESTEAGDPDIRPTVDLDAAEQLRERERAAAAASVSCLAPHEPTYDQIIADAVQQSS